MAAHPYSSDVKVWIDKPNAALRARVNQATFEYPLRIVLMDTITTGLYTDVEVGMTVLFGSTAGGDDLGRSYITQPAASNGLFIGRCEQGDHDGEVNLADNAYITVLNDFRGWSKVPQISSGSGVRQTEGWRTFAAHGKLVPVIVMNCGLGVQADVNPANSRSTFSFNASATYAAEPGASIASFAYRLPAGAIVTAGAINTASVTFTIQIGVHWLHLDVEDSEGTPNTRHVRLIAETDGNIEGWELQPYDYGDDGQVITLKLIEPVSRSTAPEGTGAYIWQKENYAGVVGSVAGPTGSEHMLITGWLDTETSNTGASDKGTLSDTTLRIIDVAQRARQLMIPPVNTGNEDDADSWDEMADANFDKLMVRTAYEYSTLLSFCDFKWSGAGATYNFTRWDTSGSNLWDVLKGYTYAMGGGKYALTFDEWGRMAVPVDPILVDPGDRTAEVLAALGESDWSSIKTGRDRSTRYRFLWGNSSVPSSGQASETKTVPTANAVAPGQSGGAGDTEKKVSGFVAPSDELVTLLKHLYERLGTPDNDYIIDLTHGGNLGISPAAKKWITVTQSADTAAQRGQILTNARMLPTKVRVNYDAQSGVMSRTVTAEKETVGVAAEAFTPKQQVENSIPPITSPGYNYGIVPTVPPGVLARGTNIVFAFADDGYKYRVGDFQTPSTLGGPQDVTRVTLGLSDAVTDAVQDAYTKTRAVVVTVGTNAIYHVSPIGSDTPTVTLKKTLRAAITNTVLQWRMVDASFGADYIVVVSYYGNSGADSGTWYTYSTDGGLTWSTETRITANYNSASGGAEFPGLFVSSRNPGQAWIGAYTLSGLSGAAESDIFKLTGTFASPTAQSYGANDILPRCIHRSWADNENTAYWTVVDYAQPAATRSRIYRKIGAGARVDVTPTVGTDMVGIFYTRGLHTCPLDANLVAVAGIGNLSSGVLVSADQGDSWTQITPGTTTNYNGAELVDNRTTYAWGGGGSIGYCDDPFGGGLLDERGVAAAFPSAGRIVRMMGG